MPSSSATRSSRVRVPIAPSSLSATSLSCAVNPVTGERNFVMMSEKEEIELGKKSDPQVRQQYATYDNPALQAYVQKVGEKLGAKSHRANLIYRFTVLDSEKQARINSGWTYEGIACHVKTAP